MDAASLKKLRRRIENIVGGVTLRPSRARELEDELYDHAIEAAEAGEEDPVASLGDESELKRAINKSFLKETALFIVLFLAVHAIWQMYMSGWHRIIFSFVYFIPSEGFRPYFTPINLESFVMNFIPFAPMVLIAFILRRFYFSLSSLEWSYKVAYIAGIILLMHILMAAVWSITGVFQDLQTNPQWTAEVILANHWNSFINDLIPVIGNFAFAFKVLIGLLFAPIGIVIYFNRSLKPLARAALLILFAVIQYRIIFVPSFMDGRLKPAWDMAGNCIVGFGYGFWIGFYLAVFDRIWTSVAGVLGRMRKHAVVGS